MKLNLHISPYAAEEWNSTQKAVIWRGTDIRWSILVPGLAGTWRVLIPGLARRWSILVPGLAETWRVLGPVMPLSAPKVTMLLSVKKPLRGGLPAPAYITYNVREVSICLA